MRLRPLVAALLLGLLAAARPAPAETLAVAYHVYVGGIHGLTVEASFALPEASGEAGDTAYLAAFEARTDNLIGRIYPYRLSARSAGLSAADGLRPAHFQSLAERRSGIRKVRLRYAADGSVAVEREPEEPPRPAPDRVPVTEAMTRDTLDPGSALVLLFDTLARTGRCAGTAPVYDGRYRYDLVARTIGPAELEASRYGAYAGPAVECELAVRPVAGFRRKWAARLPETVRVWLAPPIPGAPPLPVRIEASSYIGAVRAHLVRAGPVEGSG